MARTPCVALALAIVDAQSVCTAVQPCGEPCHIAHQKPCADLAAGAQFGKLWDSNVVRVVVRGRVKPAVVDRGRRHLGNSAGS